jgi:hypothetical protein
MGILASEQLTTNFYVWEERGRGWSVWDFPVELEPPFEPFHHLYPAPSPVDDGRKPTALSSFADSISKFFRRPAESDRAAMPEESYGLITPFPFECEFDVKELAIGLPVTEKVTPDYAEELLLNLGSCSWPLSFEVIGSKDSISVQLACREPDLDHVKQQVLAYHPESSGREGAVLRSLFADDSKETAVIDCALDQEFMRPLRVFNSFDPDPSVGIYAVLESLGADETALVQVLFQASRNAWASSIMRSVRDSWGEPFFADAPEMLPLAKEKIKRPLFAAVLRVVAQSRKQERAWDLAKNLVGSLTTLSQPESNILIPLTNEGYYDRAHLEDVILRQSRRCGMLLNSAELAGIVHLPSLSVKSSKLRGQERKTRAVPSIGVGHRFVLGENIHQGTSTQVSLDTEQRLKHVHIIGATGTGKSTLLIRMILQDFEQGNGCAVLDPHGDLIDAILERVPSNRAEDVVLFDPADTESPVGFNMLEARSEVEKNVLASDLVAIFRRFATSWGDQMTTVLGHAVSAFLESRQVGTLSDLRRFLIEKEYRQTFLQTVQDPAITYFWEKEFPLLKGASLSSILTRLDIFLRPRTVRNVVGQAKGIDCEEIVRAKKILLAKLAQGLIGEENAYLLGSLLISKLNQVVMGRQARSAELRTPFFLYLDEFQHFVTPSMGTILGGARKFSMGLVLAHQDLRQLWTEDAKLANSVITNPGTRVCFRLGDFDAEKLNDGFAHFDASDLQNLGVGDAIARIERRDFDFNLATFPIPKVDPLIARSVREGVSALSRKKYGQPVTENEAVQEHEEEQIAVTPPPAPIEVSKIGPEVTARDSGKRPVELPEAPFLEEVQKGREHRYLQALIKRLAEDRGYKAVIEEPTPDGLGRVDVGLELNGEKLAVEISVTTSETHELQNIEKCLRAGYATILVCSPYNRNLKTIKKIVKETLGPVEQEKVAFCEPEELPGFFEARTPKEAVREERVKGYRVKTEYKAVSETEQRKKREAIERTVAQSLQRLRGKP